MKTLQQLCIPRPSVFDPQRRETVLDLADLRDGRIDPAEFFETNYLTEGMKTLLKQSFRRLEGKPSHGIFKLKQAMGDGFGGSLLRQALFAVQQTVKSEEARDGLNWLKTEMSDYWTSREKIVHLLGFLSALRYAAPMAHWQKDAAAAGLLAGAARNDHV